MHVKGFFLNLSSGNLWLICHTEIASLGSWRRLITKEFFGSLSYMQAATHFANYHLPYRKYIWKYAWYLQKVFITKISVSWDYQVVIYEDVLSWSEFGTLQLHLHDFFLAPPLLSLLASSRKIVHFIETLRILKVPTSGQIGSTWEWYHWIGLEKEGHQPLWGFDFLNSLLNIWKDKLWAASCKNESNLLLLGSRFA